MAATLQELQDAPMVEPNHKLDPAQTEEAEASAPPKKTKRKREAKKDATMVSEEKIEEEALAPNARKHTPEKRKSKKDGEVGASTEEIPSQQTPPMIELEEVVQKAEEPPKKREAKKRTPPKRKIESSFVAEEYPQPREKPIAPVEPPKIVVEVERETMIKLEEVVEKVEEPPKKREVKKKTPPKRKVESSSVAEESPQPREKPIAPVEPPKIVVEVERKIVIKLEELARRQTKATRVLSRDLLDLFPSSSSLESTK
ncbi:FK506-binding protein 4-like [Cryptomeria japonica]|uniref:FK506-binding protein 4-like n=1 Tax=Cryptomeria japonica TaxID=3369 RepID=UPI0027DA2E74|nr:FK506-binding protein 4-like [Cryptomeria japonica]